MEWKKKYGSLFDEIEPVVRGMGFSLVELSRQQTKGRLQVRLVIYHYRGVGLKDCETIHRTILPRIELIEQSQDIYLEVTSPGITRNIKYAHEFSVFVDRQVNVLGEDESDWVYGKIANVDEHELELETAEGTYIMPIEKIKKARLAYAQEDNNRK
ncbi:MAG: ribosome assembly cofactor RimP [Sediminispirochaetaceae bacterium]